MYNVGYISIVVLAVKAPICIFFATFCVLTRWPGGVPDLEILEVKTDIYLNF